MRKPFAGLLVFTLVAVVASAFSTMARHHEGAGHHQPAPQTTAQEKQADPLSGVWNASFFAPGATIPATFELKLEGTKVTGSVNSDYTGPGTIGDGSWVEGKLSLKLNFEKRESIAIEGTLKEGKLAGEFTTQGFSSTWEAVKK